MFLIMVFGPSWWCLFLVCIIRPVSLAKHHYRLYHSDRVSDSDLQHDCLLYKEGSLSPQSTRTYIIPPYQIIPFCIRPPDLSRNVLINDESFLIHGTGIPFETLRNANVTSEHLYFSSVPIDVVERYQSFLESSNKSLSTQKIYNCSIPWFGEFCQYTFNSTSIFDALVIDHFQSLSINQYSLSIETCLIFLKCNRGPPPSCLDWREICDGKIDCLDDGSDERGCDDLETGECSETEFVCGNGLCIPNDFFDDDVFNPDCVDRSDERDTIQSDSYLAECLMDPGFRCEETACRYGHDEACGQIGCSTTGCHSQRARLLRRALFSWEANFNFSFDCWTNLICLTGHGSDLNLLNNVTCPKRDVSKLFVRERCPFVFFFPAQPIMFGHVRFGYEKNLINEIPSNILTPHYVCYDMQLCESLPATMWINESSCRLWSQLNLPEHFRFWTQLERSVLDLFAKWLTTKNNSVQCPKSKPYRCANSTKCLALNRLVDGFADCFQGDDEQIKDSCSLPDRRYRFRCLTEDKCISIKIAPDGAAGCPTWKNDQNPFETLISKQMEYPLSFSILCDGYVDHLMIDGLNYTDEMDCEYWPCNNVYTRCDDMGIWNCLNGADEADCPRNPCRPDSHLCILPHNYNWTCLPVSQCNDGIVDCLGAYDERVLCKETYSVSRPFPYRCLNESKCVSVKTFCYGPGNYGCASGEEDGPFCENIPDKKLSCTYPLISDPLLNLNENSYLCNLDFAHFKPKVVYFTLQNHQIYPSRENIVAPDLTTTTITKVVPSTEPNFHSSRRSTNDQLPVFCNRGIVVYTSDSRGNSCLCPPAYFGHQCEYQSERVSLTLLFRTTAWRTIFSFVIMLVDNNTTIHSYEQIEYLSMRDCRKKFNVYLLYSTRPKQLNSTYSVQVHGYDRAKMEYYASMFYPVRFPFLPVYRLSVQVDIPAQGLSIIFKDCQLKCFHGQCVRYLNFEKFFCRCLNGYSGALCTIENNCNCSPGSICVGTVNNRSICVCPLGKFGTRCYLKSPVCMSSPCHHDGQCVATDETEYSCICPERFIGLRCEKRATQIEFTFAETILIPQSMLIHLIFVPSPPSRPFEWIEIPSAEPTLSTQISKIGFGQKSTVIYYGGSFHLIFVELNHDYYLAVLQHNHTVGMNLSTIIIPEYRCIPIDELLNHSIRALPTWHRVKSYHIPCQERSNLVCFYDKDQFLCLCNTERHANCFKFDYQRVYNCLGSNYCENGGQCYQDNNTCPTISSCFCTECYYGSRCQFTSTGFGLSLDAILGYSIWPNIPFSHQPVVIKFSAALTTVMFILAIINAVLSMITFRTKQSLQIGCGVYLLASSITCFLTMTMFALKFLLLVLSQLSMTTNYSFLLASCICLDVILKVLLTMGDWLNACVAIERGLTIQLGTNFNKLKSKRAAKWVIFGVVIFTCATFLHDPVHRHLLEDKEEQRMWCVLRYPSSLQIFVSLINIFHFVTPFSINLISTLFLIILIARLKAKTHTKQTYRLNLLNQFHRHKHHLISSFILVIIAMPRLVIALVSECMKSARNPWLFLASYFVSFVPPLLTFALFVLPSKFYRKEFLKATVRIKTAAQRRLNRT